MEVMIVERQKNGETRIHERKAGIRPAFRKNKENLQSSQS